MALAACVCGLLGLAGTATAGPLAYVANGDSGTISVFDTATNTVTATIPVGSAPGGVAVTPDRTKVYVANSVSGTVSVISTATNAVTKTIPIGNQLKGIAVSPDGAKVYVANYSNPGAVSVISTATDAVTSTIPTGSFSTGLAVSPNGAKVFVANGFGQSVSVIDAAANAVSATINIAPGSLPWGVAVTPDGSRVYVANQSSSSVTVINTATNGATSITLAGAHIGVGISPDGSRAYVSNSDLNSVSVIATATGAVVATIPLAANSGPAGLALSPDGGKLYIDNLAAKSVGVVNTADNAIATTIAGIGGGSAFSFGIAIAPSAPPSGTLVASVLPQARSTIVGGTVTAFVNMINAGATAKTNCRPKLASSNAAPVTFQYQTADAQNQLTGAVNTPATLAAGVTQNFVIGMTANAVYNGPVGLNFLCDDDSAPLNVAVNDFTLVASVAQPPDIIPTAVTPSGDGVIRVNAPGGVQAMATAAVNIGATAQITVTPVVIGGSSVPIDLTVYETNASGGALTQALTSQTTSFVQNVPRFYAVLATAKPALGVPLQPDKLRVVLKFTDDSGILRGQTSEAITAPAPPSAPGDPLGFSDSSIPLAGGGIEYGTSLTYPGGFVYFESDEFSAGPSAPGRAVYFQAVIPYTATFSGGPVNGTLTATSDQIYRYSDYLNVANGKESAILSLAGIFTTNVGGTSGFSSSDLTGKVLLTGTSQFSASSLNLNTVTPQALTGNWTVQNPRAEAGDQVSAGTMTFSPTGSISGLGLNQCSFSGQLSAAANAPYYMNIDDFSVSGTSCQIEVLHADRAFIFKQTAGFKPFPILSATSGEYYEIVYWKNSANRAGVIYLNR